MKPLLPHSKTQIVYANLRNLRTDINCEIEVENIESSFYISLMKLTPVVPPSILFLNAHKHTHKHTFFLSLSLSLSLSRTHTVSLTPRQKDTHKHRHTKTQTHTNTDTHKHKHADTDTDADTHTLTNTHTHFKEEDVGGKLVFFYIDLSNLE